MMKAIVKHKHNILCSNSFGQGGGTRSLIFFDMNQFDFNKPETKKIQMSSTKQNLNEN